MAYPLYHQGSTNPFLAKITEALSSGNNAAEAAMTLLDRYLIETPEGKDQMALALIMHIAMMHLEQSWQVRRHRERLRAAEPPVD